MYAEDDDGTAVNRTAITLSASGGDNDMVHITNDVSGYYDLEMTAAQLNVLGRVTLVFTDVDVHLPVFQEYSVLPAQVYDSLFGTDKLQVHAAEITDGLITAAAIADGAIDAATFAANAITSTVIADDAITAAKLNTGAITADAFAADAIVAATLATGAISADAIAANTITATAIADDAITSAKINTGAFTADAFAADALVAATFATDCITNDALAATAVSEIQTGLSTLTQAQAEDACDAALVTYDAPTKAELDSGLDALPTAAEIRAEMDTNSAQLAAILADTDDIGIAGAGLTALAQASVCTEARLAELDAANLPADIDAVPTVAELLAGVIEGTITLKDTLRVALAVLAGESTGGGTGTIVFKNQAVDQDVVTATVDGSNNRTVIVLDVDY